jgi:hypothetical protein
MSKQQQREEKSSVKRKPQLVIADIPVKISILHDTEPLKEYEDVIPVEFDPKTPEGNKNAYRLQQLGKMGVSTENALFEIASEQVKKAAHHTVSALPPELTKRLAGQSVHVHVKRNGEITYRAME